MAKPNRFTRAPTPTLVTQSPVAVVEERRLLGLRPRDAGVEEPEHLDRDRAVVEPALAEPEIGARASPLNTRMPAAEQAIELRDSCRRA